MFRKILIANRGEIAVRVVRACRDLGIAPVAVFSAADANALHVRMSDEAYCIGPPPSAQSYLNLDADIAAQLGYPVMLKAVAGGGGKGMRQVAAESELQSALETARSEAVAAFGNNDIYLEKVVERPRHIEVQIFADTHGQVVHLGERECSIQRRHQKVIEECPSPINDPELRLRMGEAAIRIARTVSYVGAGTVEFLLSDVSREFYFLEMNTRLQV